MRRLNPATGRPFERGDMRADGKQFKGYQNTTKRNGYQVEEWVDAVRYKLKVCLRDCRETAVEKGLPFNIDLEFLYSIKTDECPVFKTPFNWNRLGEERDQTTPSLDKVFAHLGYVKGNVIFLSHRANSMKNDARANELFAVANWLVEKEKEVLEYVKTQPAAPIPTGPNRKSQDNQQLGLVLTTGAGEDDDNSDYCQGTLFGEDIDHSAQESSGDSVACRSAEVGAPQEPTRVQDYGLADAEIVRLDFGRGHLFD
jgi:hypothetical protein